MFSDNVVRRFQLLVNCLHKLEIGLDYSDLYSAKHQINRELRRGTKIEVIRGEAGGFMNCRMVGKEGLRSVVLVTLHCFQDCFNSPIESFYLSIALRMVSGSSRGCNSQQLTVI